MNANDISCLKPPDPIMRKSILKPELHLPQCQQPMEEGPKTFKVRVTNINDCDTKDIFMLFSGVQDLSFIHVSESGTFAILSFHEEESALEFIKNYNKYPYHSLLLEASLI